MKTNACTPKSSPFLSGVASKYNSETEHATAVTVESELAAHEFRNRIRRPQLQHLVNGNTSRIRLKRSRQTGQRVEAERLDGSGAETEGK